MTIALVTTTAGAVSVVAHWISTHQALGVKQVYLFADCDAELAALQAHASAGVRVVSRADALAAWPACEEWARLSAYQHQVYARQILNCALAMRWAKAEGHSWLLHLDTDEFLYAEQEGDDFEAFLARHAEVDQMRFVNQEAVPQAWHIPNYFASVNLFKRNSSVFTPTQQRLVQQAWGGDRYYLAYGNGKSAVNLQRGCTGPHGVHEFAGGTVRHLANRFSVLHYATCGYNWYAAKFLTLGDFDENLLGIGRITDGFPFLAQSKAAFGARDPHQCTALYERYLMRQGGLPHSLTFLLDAGILFYNRQPTFTVL